MSGPRSAVGAAENRQSDGERGTPAGTLPVPCSASQTPGDEADGDGGGGQGAVTPPPQHQPWGGRGERHSYIHTVPFLSREQPGSALPALRPIENQLKKGWGGSPQRRGGVVGCCGPPSKCSAMGVSIPGPPHPRPSCPARTPGFSRALRRVGGL